jgi:hypothetical protein
MRRSSRRASLFVNLVAQRERVHVKLLGQLVHRLLERETALRVARRAEGGGGARVREDVRLFGQDRGHAYMFCAGPAHPAPVPVPAVP